MCRVRNVLEFVLVVGLVGLLAQTMWAEEKGVSSDTEFEVVIPKVTIDVKDTPVSSVLAELNKQTGVELKADREVAGRTVTLQVSDVPVLQALATVAKLTGSRLGEDFFEGGLQLRRSSEGEPPQLVAVAGPCVLTILGTPWSDGSDCFFMAQGYVVARPTPVNVGEPTIKEVIDAEGSPVKKEEDAFAFGPSGTTNPVEDAGGGVGSFTAHVSASGFDPQAPFPRSLRGTIALNFALESAEVTFDLQADVGQTKKVGDVQITYKGQQEEEEGFGGGPSYSLSANGDLSKVSGFALKDAAGKEVRIAGRSRSTSGDSMDVGLQPDGEAKTVTCQVVLKAVTRTYPFEFKDTPAPKEE